MILVIISNMQKSTRIILGLQKIIKDYNTLNRSLHEVYMDNHKVLVIVINTHVSKGEDMWTLGTN